MKDSNFFNYVQVIGGQNGEIKEIDFNKIEIVVMNISMEGIVNVGRLNACIFFLIEHMVSVIIKLI